MDDAITSIYELLDAIEAVIKAADPAKREAEGTLWRRRPSRLST